MQTLGPSLFYKNSSPSKNFQTMFLLARVLPRMKLFPESAKNSAFGLISRNTILHH